MVAALAERLPDRSIEYNRADLPIGVDGKPERPAIPVGEAIRRVAESGCWAVLKNIEQDPAYADLVDELLEELRPEIEAKTDRAPLVGNADETGLRANNRMRHR